MDRLGDLPGPLVKAGQPGPGSLAAIQRNRREILLFRLRTALRALEQAAPKPAYEAAAGKERERLFRCRKRFGRATERREKTGGVGPLIERPGRRISPGEGQKRSGRPVHPRTLDTG